MGYCCATLQYAGFSRKGDLVLAEWDSNVMAEGLQNSAYPFLWVLHWLAVGTLIGGFSSRPLSNTLSFKHSRNREFACKDME